MREIIEKFFEKLSVKLDSIEIKQDEKWFTVIIQSPESGLLIWPQWKNLDAIIAILRQMINSWENKVKLRLEVNDYQTSKDSRLFHFIQLKIDEVKKSWLECKLPTYSPYERKKIHWYIAELNDDEIVAQSKWEWEQRRMYISKKAKKLTIDIDWDDI